MAVSLGDINLDEDLALNGHLNSSGLMAASARATMGGICIQSIPMSGGKTLTLSAAKDGDTVKGAFTRAQVEEIAALRDAGAPVPLVHHLGSWKVWLAPDAINVSPALDRVNPGADEWYVGTITMITV